MATNANYSVSDAKFGKGIVISIDSVKHGKIIFQIRYSGEYRIAVRHNRFLDLEDFQNNGAYFLGDDMYQEIREVLACEKILG